MSYARFGWEDSDVYVFLSGHGLTCQNCMLFDEDAITSFNADSTEKMVDHLKKHVKAGHTVPEDTIQLLLDDDEENFPKEEEE
jgi:hypothetical protein